MAGFNEQTLNCCILRDEKGFTMNEFGEQETPNHALGLVKEFVAVKERHDLDATMALFSDGCVRETGELVH